MEKIVYLVEYLVKQIVKETDKVSVMQKEDENEYSVIEVIVSESDMGAIIGKGGSIANSIRTIAQGVAYANGEKKVKVNINSI